MSRVAKDFLRCFNDLTKQLEEFLGPDTGDLRLRIGLHSGNVTAGVLRGDNCRFQLFGDTVNTACQIELKGLPNRIHISSTTHALLEKGGKGHWTIPRKDAVSINGNENYHSYWLDIKYQSGASQSSGGSSKPQDLQSSSMDAFSKEFEAKLPSKSVRLVKFNTECLLGFLKQIVARRNASYGSAGPPPSTYPDGRQFTSHPFDEVKEIITLPKYNAKAAENQQNPKYIQLDPKIERQLYSYIYKLATMYRQEVPFHNFSHASHVTMSVVKMLSRIVAPDVADGDNEDVLQSIHNTTFGITSDPLTQFSVILAALIHDVDHTGLPNATLIAEGAPIAATYENKSVAEQNSVDLSWNLLMSDEFADLRAVIYTNEEELKRFRALLVNTVMATDIVDKELKNLRNARWEKAFKGETVEESKEDVVNRKATIVLEVRKRIPDAIYDSFI